MAPDTRGWERGTEKVDFAEVAEVPPPPDRVLTYEYREELSSPFSKFRKSTSQLWRGSDEALIKELLAKWGEPPESL